MRRKTGLFWRIVTLGTVGLAVLGVSKKYGPFSRGATLQEEKIDNITESAAGLESQLETLLAAAKSGNPVQLNLLIDDLKIPEKSQWFADAFGEKVGTDLAAKYRDSWQEYRRVITDTFQDIGNAKYESVIAERVSLTDPNPKTPFVHSILRQMKNSSVLHIAKAKKDRFYDSFPGAYVYVQGQFRILNWGTLYSLADVKPMRVRQGSQVVGQRVIHKAEPALPHEKQMDGKVEVRVVIDCDGKVAQADLISGPRDLAVPSVEAVRKWYYRPTTVNGDPVEVDTLVVFVFPSHQ